MFWCPVDHSQGSTQLLQVFDRENYYMHLLRVSDQI